LPANNVSRRLEGSRVATLFLTCGLPGSGKTTLAKRLERERGALRLTADEWIHALFGPEPEPAAVQRGEAPDPKRSAVEALQWQVAARALTLDLDVVIDWGVWTRRERDDYRAQAHALGARCVVCFLDIPRADLERRLRARNANLEPGMFPIELSYLDLWESWFEPPTEDELRDDT
jgi:predicted kinase